MIAARFSIVAIVTLWAAQPQAFAGSEVVGQDPLLDALIIEPGHLDILLPPAVYSDALARGCEARFESYSATVAPPPQLTPKTEVLAIGNPPLIQRRFYDGEFLLCAETWQGEPNRGLLRTVSIYGETVSLEYDEMNRLIRRTHEDTLHDSDSRITRYEYPTSSTMIIDGPRDDVNDVRQLNFDKDGNVVEFVNAAGHLFAMEYDSQGHLVVWNGPNGDRREYEYDDQGNMIVQRVAVGTKQETAIELEYNAAGRLVAWRRQGEGTIRRSYDEEGRLASVSNDKGTSLQLSYAWDGTLQAVFASEDFGASQPGGDEGGVLPSLNGTIPRPALQGLPDFQNQTEAASYQLDLLGRMVSATFADGSVTRFEHNGFGEVIAAHHSAQGAMRFQYDAAGNRMREFGQHGTEIWRTFDELGRVTGEEIDLSGTLPQSIQYRYDSCANGIGRLCETRSRGSTMRFEYDALGNAIYPDAIEGNSGGTNRNSKRSETRRLLSSDLASQSYDGTRSHTNAGAEAGTTAFRHSGNTAPSMASPPSTRSTELNNVYFYSSSDCRGWAHSGVHVDSLAEAWSMGFRSYTLLASVTVYLENGDVLSGKAYVCVLIHMPINLAPPSTGYVYVGPPSSSTPPEQTATTYKLGICTRNVNNVTVPDSVGGVQIPAVVRASLNSAIPDHQDAMLVKGSDVKAKGLHPVSLSDAVGEAALHLTLKDLPSSLRRLLAPSLSAKQWDSYVSGQILNANPMWSIHSTECGLSEVTESRYNTALAGVNSAINRPPDYSLLYRHCQHWAREICK